MQAAHSLLSLSADVNACSKTGDTALHAAYSARDVVSFSSLFVVVEKHDVVTISFSLVFFCSRQLRDFYLTLALTPAS